ncbi:hypothetical protein EYR40_003578 [Pleurotus pulmonarius]|nr:hypothetical protein EYR40_003578 [Pleurotus pulmonarius]
MPSNQGVTTRARGKRKVVDLCDSSPEPEPSPKYSRTKSSTRRASKASIITPEDSDEDEDFQLILQQIKDQEESEALAKRLQEETASTSLIIDNENADAGSSMGIVDHECHSEELEDDEAMARRLAAEWATQDSFVNNTNHSQIPDTRPTSAREGSLRIQKDAIYMIPPDEQLSEYKDLFTGERSCTSCGSKVRSPQGVVTFESSKALPTKLQYLLHASCPSPLSSCPVLDCCAEVRALAVFETLGAFDRLVLHERENAGSRARKFAIKVGGANSVGPGGTGYSTGGNTFARPQPQSYAKKKNAPVVNSSEDHTAHSDYITCCALETLVKLLPAPYSPDPQTYDFLPHPSLGPLLALSQLTEVLSSLLRNDSISDWGNRSGTYQTVLSFLRRMADSEVTLRRLVEKRWEMKQSCSIGEWMWGKGEIIWERKGKSGEGAIVRGVPLYHHFQKLTRQSEAFLSGALQMVEDATEDAEVDEAMMQTISLCGDIIAARDDIQRTMAALGSETEVDEVPDPEPAFEIADTDVDKPSRKIKGKGSTKAKGKTKAPNVSVIEGTHKIDQEYAQACEQLAFKYVRLADGGDNGQSGLKYSSFNFNSSLSSSSNETRIPKDRMHLVKELAVMATSLPPGIWVRVDEARNDVIKIMIAGPEGTPYANGLFEFDCFMPLNYPKSPPKMHLRTTGKGRVGFNPNLYACGKVCLSLLGTWHGGPNEGWVPYKSTLLQVLVSIQSMILIDLPWFNEPGRGKATADCKPSNDYNKEIAHSTAIWAILDWLHDKHRNGVWADVIASHFTLRSAQTRAQ